MIVGAGGFARETAQAVAAINAVRPTWRLLGFLDDDPLLHGRRVDGLPVIGGTDLMYSLPNARVVVCVGNPRNYLTRARIVERLGLPADRYATICILPPMVSGDSVIGPGSVLLAQAVLTAAVTVGAHVAVMPHAVLTHDVTVDDFATIASGVRFGGGVRVRARRVPRLRGADPRAGQDRRLVTGRHGSVVLQDIPAGQVWVGNPARKLRDIAVEIPERLA